MEKNYIVVNKAKRSQNHLDFYLEHGISPVHQDISNISTHIERRNSLYRYLGLASGYFNGKKILEVGPASGHNSLYIAASKPAVFDLLEPNPVAVKEIYELYRHFNLPHKTPNVIAQTLEEFENYAHYDVVICEAWLGISDHERGLMKKLAGFVKKEGVLVTTLASPVGYFFNLVRRLIANQFLEETDNLEEKSKKLLIAFSQHLQSLKDMTCPHIDWVQDSLINPGFLTMHPAPKSFFHDIGPQFCVYNSYPRFVSDWRWYKSLYGSNKNFNEYFLNSYYKNSHNFLDYRFIFNERSSEMNKNLEKLCLNLNLTLTKYENKKSGNLIAEMIEIIELVRNNVSELKGEIVESIDEMLHLYKYKRIEQESVKQMKYFSQCFGRELLYISVIREY